MIAEFCDEFMFPLISRLADLVLTNFLNLANVKIPKRKRGEGTNKSNRSLPFFLEKKNKKI